METETDQPVTWSCSGCDLALHLAGTLWRTDDGSPFCKAAPADPIVEQYAAAGVHREALAGSRMHMPRSSWAHPALRKGA